MVPTLPSNLKRWSFDQFVALGESGLFDEHPHVELIDGQIYEKMPQKHPHALTVSLLIGALKEVFGAKSALWVQSTVKLGPMDGPEPDLALFRGQARDYLKAAPMVSDLLLVVEVADSTFADDLREKAPLYARFGIPEFWLVDVKGRRVLVHRAPKPESQSWDSVTEVDESGFLLPLEGGEKILVADLLPDPDVE